MFYSHHVLARKGALGKVWVAAHWDKKLSKAAIWETKIPDTVDSIVSPEVPMALRLSGQLLLGVVRIYSRKVSYLYQDCNDALAKIKLAFRPGVVDLPAESQIAAVTSITLPDSAAEFELLMPDTNDLSLPTIDQEQLFSATLNLSRPQDITMSQSQPGVSLSYNADDDDFFGTDPNAASQLDPNLSVEMPRNLSADDSAIEVLRGNPVHAEDAFEDFGGADDFNMSNDMMMTPGKGADMSMDISLDVPDMDVGDTPGPSIPGTPGTGLSGVRLSEAAIDSVQVKPSRKRRRKRALYDETTYIDADTMRSNLKDQSDIVRDFVPLPANKRQARELNSDNADFTSAAFWSQPTARMGASKKAGYQRTMKFAERPDAEWDEDVELYEPAKPVGEEEPVDEDANGADTTFGGDDQPSFDDAGGDGFDMSFGDGIGDQSFGGDLDVDPVPDTDDAPVPLVDDDVDAVREPEGPSGQLSKEALEAGWTPSAILFQKEIGGHFDAKGGKNPSLSLKEMLAGEKRGAAAQKFFQLLVLRKLDRIDVHQPKSYADVTIKKTKIFDDEVPVLKA